jgi:phage FluMu protein Com
MSLQHIPDIRTNVDAWFDFFNRESEYKGMHKTEVLQAILETVNAMTGEIPDIDALMSTMDEIWTFSGLQPEDRRSLEKFKCHGGLHEVICAHLPQVSNPTQPARACSSAGSGNIRVRCGRCQTVMLAIPPVSSPSSFFVKCVTCHTSNKITSRTSSTPVSTRNVYYDVAPSVQYVVYRPSRDAYVRYHSY